MKHFVFRKPKLLILECQFRKILGEGGERWGASAPLGPPASTALMLI